MKNKIIIMKKNRDFDDKKIKQEKQKNSYDYDRDYNDKMK